MSDNVPDVEVGCVVYRSAGGVVSRSLECSQHAESCILICRYTCMSVRSPWVQAAQAKKEKEAVKQVLRKERKALRELCKVSWGSG